MTIESITREAYSWLRVAGYAGPRCELARPDYWPAPFWALMPVDGKPTLVPVTVTGATP